MTRDYHLSTFVSTIFKHCTSGGDLSLYVFPHATSGRPRAERQEWVGRHNLAAMGTLIEYARTRPSSVFCPPVALYGPGLNGAGRRTSADSNILEAPAIALELDDTPTESRALAETVLGTPTLVVRSGGVTATGEDKLHLYWRLTQPARTQEEQAKLKAIRGALAEVFNGDTSGVPLGHPMRWPGSWHTKGAPRLCEIIERSESEVDLGQAYDALMLMAPQRTRVQPGAREGFKTAVALSGPELDRLLAKVPNGPHVTWEEWNRTGMTVFDASHGSDEGLAAFHNWSSSDGRYSPDETDARWYHWFASPPTDLSAASLYHAAGESVPRATGEEMFGDPVDMPAGVLPEPPVVTRAKAAGYGIRDGGIMHPEEQMDHFAGCVYVKKHKLIMMPDGSESDHSQFDDEMGGHRFVFMDGKTTKSAWEAFLRNERYSAPRVHDTCFRPELEPMAIVQEEGWALINAYMPIQTECTPGDPSPWLDHLTKMYPVEEDRKILISWMASCLRNPGKKFQWWPVLIGAKGNAKTMILNIMEYCVGSRYTHLPNAGKMTRNGINFNGWIRNKLFLGVEEVYSANRRDFLEEFKPYVTNRRLPIEGKGIEEYTGDNRANGMLTSNHWDGVPIDSNERRYGIFFTAQQTAEDCIRDGLTSAYFSKLWSWLDAGGFAIVNHYLRNYPLEAVYDPARLSTRAPRTSSTDQAIAASLGSIEQEILQAIEEERMGFKGGWISSKALDGLFREKGIKLAPNKRIGPIRAIGYDLHPSLPEGKTARSVPPDGVRCRLYCLKDGPGWSDADPTEAYMKAQLGA